MRVGSPGLETESFEADVRAWGHRLADHLPAPAESPKARIERRVMASMIDDPRLRAALFRFVDVRPACRNRADLVRHLREYLDEADGSETARRLSSVVGRAGFRWPTASVAAFG